MTHWQPDPNIAPGDGFLRRHGDLAVALAYLDGIGRWRAWARGPSLRWIILPNAAGAGEARRLADAVLAAEWPADFVATEARPAGGV